MSGFVATATAAQLEPEVENDGWFPAITLTGVREALRLDGTVTIARLRDAVAYAMDSVNAQLADYKAAHVNAGVDGLQDVSAAQIGGEPRLVMLYRRAVHNLAHAELIERYRNLDATDSGMRRVLDMEPAIGELRRNASWAVRDILGQSRTVVELI